MKKFNKHYVKRDPATQLMLKDNGETFDYENDDPRYCKPMLGEIGKKDNPLEDRHVNILNKNWNETGVYYVEMESKEVKVAKSDARIALEEEATELGIKFRDNIGDEKLQEKINEVIEG